jgi:hypothetical protein
MKADSSTINIFPEINGYNRTTCDIYSELISTEMRPSVQVSLYQYLHFAHHFFPKKHLHLKKRILNLSEDGYVLLSRIYRRRIKRYPDIDVLFNLINPYDNHLGIQKELSRVCSTNGLKTGLLGLFHKIYVKSIRGFDRLFPLGMLPVSPDIQRIISEQCRHLYPKLVKSNEEFLESSDIHDSHYALIRFAMHIEQLAAWNRHLLEATDPRLVILTNAKDPRDAAMQIACEKMDIPSMLIPHGFPQKSQHPISAPWVMSYANHHDDYLKKLCRYPEQVKSLGWLEPRKTLSFNTEDTYNNRGKPERIKQYDILFLSQFSGSRLHRCASLISRVPDIIQTLDKMKEVESITIRLRLDEMNDPMIVHYLKGLNCSKLKLSKNKSIYSDLKVHNLLISFSSTGLLYGPYLNIKSIEVRDDDIDSVWPNSILPEEQVYNIGRFYHPIEFREFVRQSPIPNGDEIFYNRGRELERFDEIVHTIL